MMSVFPPSQLLDPLAPVFNESFQGTVIGPLNLRWEEACRELSVAPVVSQALTADPLTRARLPSAGTVPQILLHLTDPLRHVSSLSRA
jgi:hypothetical protein